MMILPPHARKCAERHDYYNDDDYAAVGGHARSACRYNNDDDAAMVKLLSVLLTIFSHSGNNLTMVKSSSLL